MNLRPTSEESSRGGSQTATTSPSPRRPSGEATIIELDRRIAQLEHLTSVQSRELRIQFERIAQLQAECDILRIRFA